ncbi:Hypothetical protein, putative [Bodo saltans]|uniref:C2 domain-containing protein n=1 Tax=Bodo saltans TaxID=75058 RepID=A0A0S4KKV0_BODSA|nr:Hypothetical protein, putative [Bodo saltans]|eukprot:CUI14138.1 Hypothetical protein, putative [Bodo saltans]
MATLKVTIHEGRDLPVMDRATGLADPYVVVSLNSEYYRTGIDTGTCNPVWKFDCRFDAANLLTLQEDPVEFRVFDHDIVTRDDLIGMLYIDLNCILGRETPTLSGWFPLFDTMAGLRGELRVTLKVKFHAAENPTAPRVPSRVVRHMGSQSVITETLRRFAGFLGVGGGYATTATSFHMTTDNAAEGSSAPIMPADQISPLSPAALSPAIQYQVDAAELQPIGYLRPNQPSLTTEEEGIHIFSMSRLDPSIFRVESVLPMVEELIVKADPEHSKFTNLRSSRATNEARMLQLFKLSGKVRRQLTRKVLELQCNCVLGYEERYDLEPNGIIVRAYGTPCVVSSVKFSLHSIDRFAAVTASALPLIPALPPATAAAATQPSTPQFSGMVLAGTGSSEVLQTSPRVPHTSIVSSSGLGSPTSNKIGGDDCPVSAMTSAQPTTDFPHGLPSTPVDLLGMSANVVLDSSAAGGTIISSMMQSITTVPTTAAAPPPPPLPLVDDIDAKLIRVTNHQHQLTNNSSGGGGLIGATSVVVPAHHQRSAVITLTVSDVPSGMLYHIGGLVSARSVKLVSKLKNKLSISQERDAWWSELREEVKYNARSLHCNAIIGYEEVAMYDHEDVVVLSISGTAVVLDTTWLAMRCGPENLYHRLAHRLITGKSCAILHLYQGHHQSPHGNHHNHARHHHGGTRRDDGTVSGFLCTLCRRKSVPEVMLASCAVPLDIAVDGAPVLIQAAVSKMKPNVKGAELALCLSQALPFLEFSLHKQLIFKLQLERMNAAFGVKVEFAVGSDVIIATLSATAFRVVGLPVPQTPKLEFWEIERLPQGAVRKLQGAVERAKQAAISRTSKRRMTAAMGMSGNAAISTTKRRSAADSMLVQRSPQSAGMQQQHGTTDGLMTTDVSEQRNNESDGTSSDSGGSHIDDGASHDTWVSSSSSSASDDGEGGGGGNSGGAGGPGFGSPKKHNDVTEYTVVIDDEEEAELMVGMITGDATDDVVRLDDLVVTVPYLPMESNRYSGSQERIILSRRYSVHHDASSGSSGAQNGGLGGSGHHHIEMNTSFLNQCFLNARLMFLMRLRRLAVCWKATSMHDLRVFNFHVHCVFEPNTNDLHMVLDGLVCVAHGDSGESDKRLLNTMQNRAFDECESLLFTSGLPNRQTSPVLIGREDHTFDGTDDAMMNMGGSLGEGTMTLHGTAGSYHDLTNGFQKRWRQYRRTRKATFSRSNAPFNLPFAFRRESPLSTMSLPQDPFALLVGRSSGPLSEMRPGERSGINEQAKRTGMVHRQLVALGSLASATLRNFADRIGIGSEVVPMQQGEDPLTAPGNGGHSKSRHSSDRVSSVTNHRNSGSGSIGQQQQQQLQHKPVGALQQLLQPCSRVPSDRRALLAYDDPFFITPLSYVAGHAIVRYISRVSHHFIREAYEVYSADELGEFFTNTNMEIHGVVRALVKSLGGNALLCHNVQLHEVWDSDGSGCAFLCVTITGHVAMVTKEHVLEENVTSYAS